MDFFRLNLVRIMQIFQGKIYHAENFCKILIISKILWFSEKGHYQK